MNPENDLDEESVLIEEAIAWLRQTLPSSWTISRDTSTYVSANRMPRKADAAIDIQGSGIHRTVIVEAKPTFTPRDVERVFVDSSIVRSLRATGPDLPILVVSNWLSPRARELLEEQEINYLDLTGNALIRMDNPPMFVRSAGEVRSPRPTPSGEVRLRGPRAARVLRLLLDVRPPYGVREIANATGVALSYVSRLLDSLDRDALVERRQRGRIERVDITRLLARWADSYDLFKSNKATAYVAARGANSVVEMLREQRPRKIAVTGSFAAARYAPLAAPTLFVAYVDDALDVVERLDLLRTVDRPNVVLLRAYDPVVFDRTQRDDGLTYVSPTQAAVDCLSGNGRMPAEGEALATWLAENEPIWRFASISDADGAQA